MFQIKPIKTIRIFLTVIVLLLLGHVIGMTLKFGFDKPFAFGLVPLTDFDREGNLPTIVSSLMLLLCAVLLALIAYTVRNRKASGWIGWVGLSLLFLFVAIDESVSIHEQLIRPVREMFKLSGVLYFAWVIPYGIFALAVAA